jgi:hypothetical protein
LSELLIQWTIRVALIFAAVSAVVIAIGWHRDTTENAEAGVTRRQKLLGTVARFCWGIGAFVFLGHMIAALHFHHRWNHSHLIEETARRTAETVGTAFGEGVYFSFLFALVWVVDALWWLLSPISYVRRSRWISGAVYGFLFFIAFNGAVVFESGPTRPFGIAVTICLAGILLLRILAHFLGWQFAFFAANDNDRLQGDSNTQPVRD